jgi:peptidyl-tRNA hydrolase, PTH1 family
VWIIAGLGNPGARYRATRHNVGFLVLDELACRHGILWRERKQVALVGQGSVGAHEVLMVKPQTYMNNSGQVVGPLLKKKGAGGASLIVVHDDLDLPFGRIKIREGGGGGGHKGVQSILWTINDDGFLRVKIGIGRPEGDDPPDRYVLSPFSREESDVLQRRLEQGADAVECILREGAQRAMNRFHRRDPGPGRCHPSDEPS